MPLLAVITALPFLPEQIPAHYGADGQVTRWGSKYETLIFPGMTVLTGFIMLFMAKFAAKQEKTGKNNEQVTLVTGLVCLAIFNAMTIFFLYTDFHKVQDLNAVPMDITKIGMGILGVAMLIIGNIMPKVKMNSVIGLRTQWSMKNQITWKKCQRFAGISFVISGLLILLLSLTAERSICLMTSMVIIMVLVFADIYYSYRIAKKN